MNLLSKNQFLKVLSLNSISVIFKMIAGFVSTKMIAVFLGPSAFALLGNLKNFSMTIRKISLLGFENGIVKYTSENQSDKEKLKVVWSTAFVGTLVMSIILGIGLLVFSSFLSKSIFKSTEYSLVFIFLGGLLPLYTLHIVLLSILNGLKAFKSHVKISVLSSILGITITVFLILKLMLIGAMISLVVVESIIVIVSSYYVFANRLIVHELRLGHFRREMLKQLSSYSLMAILTAILSPVILLLIRNILIDFHGVEKAGYWEAINRLSGFYLMFIGSGISLYYLPRLSETKSVKGFKEEVGNYFRVVIPVFGVFLVVLFLFRGLVIKIIFEEQFLMIKGLLVYQFLGDFVKIISHAFSYQFIAKRMTKQYLLTEVIYFASFLLMSIILIPHYSIKGIVLSYLFSYIIYLIAVGTVLKRNKAL